VFDFIVLTVTIPEHEKEVDSPVNPSSSMSSQEFNVKLVPKLKSFYSSACKLT